MLPVNLKIYRTQNPGTKIKSSGNLLSPVVIIAHNNIPTDQKAFLENILESIELKSKDVLKIMVSDDSILRLKKILHNKKDYSLIIFGCTPTQIGMRLNAKPNEVMHISNYSLLFTYSLEKLSSSVELKKGLWMGLKKLFLKDD